MHSATHLEEENANKTTESISSYDILGEVPLPWFQWNKGIDSWKWLNDKKYSWKTYMKRLRSGETKEEGKCNTTNNIKLAQMTISVIYWQITANSELFRWKIVGKVCIFFENIKQTVMEK